MNNARINKSIYDSQVTNSTMVKALNDLQASAKANKANQFKELDETDMLEIYRMANEKEVA